MKKILNIGKNHEVIKEIRDQIKNNKDKNIIIVEDLSILELRKKYNFNVKTFLYCDDRNYSEEAASLIDFYLGIASNSYTISSKTYELITNKDNSAGLLAVIELSLLDIKKIDGNKYPFVVVTDGLEIPGNLGTILRTADACKVDLIINVDSRTSINNQKTVTGSRGMCLTETIVDTTYNEALKFLLDNDYDILLGEPELGDNYFDIEYSGKIAIVIGCERFGINKDWYNHKHHKVYIPMYGEMKSLNVSVAASILMYQAKMKRTKR